MLSASQKPVQITREQARHFVLAHQGLWPPGRWAGKQGILAYIRRVGCIQFDPLSIVGYNQELVLQARVAGFRPPLLQELLYQERSLIDGWDKNMSIYCTADWPYFARNREKACHSLRNSSELECFLPQVLKEIEKRGPLSSRDLSYDQLIDWSWAPTRIARAALETLYFRGELVIHHKARTRKVYDLASRQLPPALLQAPDPNQTEQQYHDWYILRRIGSIGLLWSKAGDAWLGMAGIKSGERSAALQRLLRQGKVIEVAVAGIQPPLYMRNEDKVCLASVLQQSAQECQASILAPLDNLLWERQLAKAMFNFDYRWEVYKPADKRVYGYYVLPVLYGDQFVARFEPSIAKQSRTLVIKNWWWEPGVSQSEQMRAEIQRCLLRFANYLEADFIPGHNEPYK